MGVGHRGIRVVLASVVLAVALILLIVPAALAEPLGSAVSVVPTWSPSSPFASVSVAARASGARPVIARLSSTSAKPGVRVTITGSGFGSRRGKSSVLFGAFKSMSYVRWSARKIVCKVPVIPAAKLTIKVRTAKRTSNGKRFTVKPLPALPAAALVNLGTVNWARISSYDGSYCAEPDFLAYYTDSAGNLAIVTQDPGRATLCVSTVNPSTLRRVGDTRSISLAGWPERGGFYAGPDGCFYVLVGRRNPSMKDDLDVVAVRRYDRNWILLGTAYIKGGIYIPFVASAPHMVLVGNRLVVHMGYLDWGYWDHEEHHQSSFTFEVDVGTMTASDLDPSPGSSHSFQQLVAMNGSSLITIDHGDAYPRAIQMGVIAAYPDQRELSEYKLFEFNGTIGDNSTGATVTGLVSGPSGIVVVGNSIRQPDAPNGTLGPWDEHRNIYAVWADPATGEHAVRWLTGFAPQGASEALEPRVLQVATNRYAVLFTVSSRVTTQTGYHSSYRMEYRLIDSAGTVLASTSFPGVFFCAISDPILIGGKVYWVGIRPNPWGGWADHAPDYLSGIDVSDPATPSLLNPTAP